MIMRMVVVKVEKKLFKSNPAYKLLALVICNVVRCVNAHLSFLIVLVMQKDCKKLY